MDIIEIKTLVDITNTRVFRSNQGTQLQLDQQRNFTTLLQCCEIRSIIDYNDSPTSEVGDVKPLNLGSNYKGKHRIWTFRFSTDRSGVYSTSGNNVGALIEDIDAIPVIKNLSETINMDKAVFDSSSDAYRNIIIRMISA